jgi:hypothetical protein
MLIRNAPSAIMLREDEVNPVMISVTHLTQDDNGEDPARVLSLFA